MDKQLKIRLIIKSSLRYTVLYSYISKKDKLLQLVQDYKKLNQHTIKNKMPLFLIGKVIDKLKEIKYFNKFDLIWSYNNIQIKEGNEWKVAFLTNKWFSNLWSCILDYVTYQWYFREWWTASSKNCCIKKY